MQRVPALSLDYARNALRSIEKIDDVDLFINSLDQNSKDMFYLAIIIATSNGSIFNKKSHKSKESLLKYLLRMSARPTPFGIFAQVVFSDSSNVLTKLDGETDISDLNICLECSLLWLNQLINLTENKNLRKIKYIRNKNCYVLGDRYYNTSYTNRADLSKNDNPIMTVDIRYTPAVSFLIELTERYISFSSLYDKFKNRYPDLDKERFERFLSSLLEGEFLYSNLRIPAYQTESLSYLIQATHESNISDLSERLNILRDKINSFCSNPNVKKLENIFNYMSNILKSDDYIVVTSGLNYSVSSLTNDIKERLENFASALSIIYVDKMDFCRLEKFKERFYDYFEANTLVPLVHVINEHEFDGLKLLEETKEQLSIREKYIQSVINHQVMLSIKEGRRCIDLSLNDFSKDIVQSDISNDFISSFDLNFILSNGSEQSIYIGPNYGALKQGNSFQRFYNLWPKTLENEIEFFYNREAMNYTEDILVDCFELQKYGKANNILNKKCNYKYCISFGTTLTENKIKELTINDLYLMIDNNRNLSIIEKKTLKRVRFVSDNMLTSLSNGRVVQLLKEITYEYDRKKVIERLNLFNNLDFLYTPRIVFEGVTVALETWRIDSSFVSINTFEDFQSDLLKFRDKYIKQDIVYLSNNDNRILINLDRVAFREILFREFKKEGKVVLQTPEDGILLESNKYLTEYVVSLRQESDNMNCREMDHFDMLYKYNTNSIVHVGEEGWISVNIYGLGGKVNDFLDKFRRCYYVNERLGITKWFYVNYFDYIGPHLRLRLQFNKTCNYENYINFFEFLNGCCREKVISQWHMVPYNREFSRYGGAALFDICENIFYIDSEEASLTCKESPNEMSTFFKLAQYGVHSFGTLKEFSRALDNYFEYDQDYRKEYRKESKKYRMLLEQAIEECKYSKGNLTCLLKELRDELQSEIIANNYKEDIIFSIMHMHCNRVLNDLSVERKLHYYLKFALWEKLNQDKLGDGVKEI